MQSSHRILVVNGPNLNLLGERRPEIYGSVTLARLDSMCRGWGLDLGAIVDTFQSNHEGAIIDRLHQARTDSDGIIINAGALTHYSYAIHDALEAIAIPTVEVHISDTANREPWRRDSVISAVCIATVFGRGLEGYHDALRILTNLLIEG